MSSPRYCHYCKQAVPFQAGMAAHMCEKKKAALAPRTCAFSGCNGGNPVTFTPKQSTQRFHTPYCKTRDGQIRDLARRKVAKSRPAEPPRTTEEKEEAMMEPFHKRQKLIAAEAEALGRQHEERRARAGNWLLAVYGIAP